MASLNFNYRLLLLVMLSSVCILGCASTAGRILHKLRPQRTSSETLAQQDAAMDDVELNSLSSVNQPSNESSPARLPSAIELPQSPAKSQTLPSSTTEPNDTAPGATVIFASSQNSVQPQPATYPD